MINAKNTIRPLTKDEIFLDGLPSKYIDYYWEHIFPLAYKYEAQRNSASNRKKIWTTIACIIFIPVSVTAVIFFRSVESNSITNLLFWIMFLCPIMAIMKVYKWSSLSYAKIVKKEIYPKIFAYFGPDFEFSPTSRLSKNDLRKSGLIPASSNIIITMEDYVRGSFKETAMELVEVKLVSRGARSSELIFRGICMILKTDTKIKGHTLIRSRLAVDRVYGGSIGLSIFELFKYDEVKLDNREFADRFEVSSTNQSEAKELLTDDLMDKLNSLHHIFGGIVMASFYDDKLFLMLKCKMGWHKEPNADARVTFIDESKNIISQMTEIFKIINLLGIKR